MPDGGAGQRPATLHALSCARFESWLTRFAPEARRLTTAELSRYRARQPIAGWRIAIQGNTEAFSLDLLVSADFPWRPPRFAIVGEARLGSWPHVERDNVLCLLADAASINPLEPEAVALNQLDEAVRLVEACIAGDNAADFLEEFETYWDIRFKRQAPPTYVLSRPAPPTRRVRMWRGGRFNVAADDDETLRAWLENYGALKPNEKLHAVEALAVWLDAMPIPAEYPQGGSSFVSFLEEAAPGAADDLKTLCANPNIPAIDVLLMANAPSGAPVAATVLVLRPKAQAPGTGDPLTRGFRAPRTPGPVVARRFLGEGRFRPGAAERADAAWVHGRDADPDAQRLFEKRVVILGLGSIGGPLALSLARAGVGAMDGVDPQSFGFQNISRHPLGARSVNLGKAGEMAALIKHSLPHIQFTAHATRFEALRDAHPEILQDADLIICAIADWSAEGALNAWALAQPVRPRILYTWAEPHACAGHAVLIGADACFACGVDALGERLFKVTQWVAPTLKREPGCGALFQPYGPVEISRVADTAAELALDALLGRVDAGAHRVWTGRRALLDAAGGAWTADWLNESGSAEGGLLLERRWGGNDRCAHCGRDRS